MRYTRRRWWLHSLCVAILVAAIAATLPAAAGPQQATALDVPQQATALGVQQLAPSAPLPALYVALLRPGWNLVGWTAAPTTAPDAAAAIAGSARSFFTFDAGAQSFRSFSPALPDALNSLREIAFWRRRLGLRGREERLAAAADLVGPLRSPGGRLQPRHLDRP